MRLPLPRATALVAILTVLVAAGGFTPPRTGPPGRERDRAVRITRSGPQRLDAPDGPIHCHEETDAVQVPAGDVVNAAGHADISPEISDPPGAVTADVPHLPSLPPPLHTRLIPERRRPVLPAGGVELCAPDRAPPTA
jgi:hypothetical protein